jgi:hypothetical protein
MNCEDFENIVNDLARVTLLDAVARARAGPRRNLRTLRGAAGR